MKCENKKEGSISKRRWRKKGWWGAESQENGETKGDIEKNGGSEEKNKTHKTREDINY